MTPSFPSSDSVPHTRLEDGLRGGEEQGELGGSLCSWDPPPWDPPPRDRPRPRPAPALAPALPPPSPLSPPRKLEDFAPCSCWFLACLWEAVLFNKHLFSEGKIAIHPDNFLKDKFKWNSLPVQRMKCLTRALQYTPGPEVVLCYLLSDLQRVGQQARATVHCLMRSFNSMTSLFFSVLTFMEPGTWYANPQRLL